MKRLFVIFSFLLVTKMGYSEPVKCDINVFDHYDILMYNLQVGQDVDSSELMFKNLLPALVKLKALTDQGVCVSPRWSSKNVCLIQSNGDGVGIDYAKIGRFQLDGFLPDARYFSGFQRVILGTGNSREEVEILGKMVQNIGFCTLQKY